MFVSKIRADSNDRSAFGSFWFEPVSMRSITGARVSNDSALRLTAVYASVRVLAETFAVLPFVLYKNKAGGGKEIITKHWLNKLFNKRPNRYQNPFEWREMLQGHLVLRGNAFNRIVVNGRGDITELIPIHPDRIKMQMLDGGDYRYIVKTQSGVEEILLREEVWHIRGLSSDGLFGMNPIEIAREAIGMGLSAQEYGGRFFANDARPSAGWIEMAGGFKDDGARKVFGASWQAAQGGANRGKVPVLENGMKYHDVSVNNKDSQFLEARQFQVAEVARIFRIPPHLIGDLSRSTNNNIEQQALEFVTHTMTPWAERWEASIETELLLDDDDLEIEFDFKKLLRGDSVARSAYYASGINAGWLTRNEARDGENLNPIDGLDEPLQPVNLVEAGETPAALPAPVPPAAPDDPKEDANARLAALAAAAAERVARRETETVAKAMKSHNWPAAVRESYEKHAGFIADVLHVELNIAGAYCEQRRQRVHQGMDMAAFEASGVSELTEMAATGQNVRIDSQAAMAYGLQAIASAIENQQAPVVNVAAPNVTVQVPAPQIDVHIPAPVAMERIAIRNADGVIEKIVDQPVRKD